MKLRLLFILIASTSLHLLYSQLTRSFRDLPQGSYMGSCRKIGMRIEGNGFDLQRVVTAECQDRNGKWKKTTIRVPVMTTGIDCTLHNDNGTLKMDELREFSLSQSPIMTSSLDE